MKRIICIAAITLALGAQAGFKVPKDVHRGDALKTALTEAKAGNKPVTILYSDEKSTCSLCSNASEEVLKDLKQKTVLVYVEHADWKSLPRPVQEAINAAELGKFIPKTVVMDSDAAKVIAYVPYSRDPQTLNKSLKEARKQIETAYGKPRRGPAPLPAATQTPLKR